MDSPRLPLSAGSFLVSLLLMALVAPTARCLPNNSSEATKESNRPSLELSFTNKLVKSEVSSKSANGSAAANSTVGSGTKDKSPISARPNTKENSTNEAILSTTLAPSARTTSWLPYYLSSDSGAIREGEAAPSRGRSGSPRRIDNFPPLQNQPGEEYLDAINRRTVLPPPPVVATTPKTATTAKTATTKKMEAPPARAGESGSISSLAFDSTTVDSEPDIGTAFSLSEDFTQGFLGFPVSETMTDADMTVKISVPPVGNATDQVASNSSSTPASHSEANSTSITTPRSEVASNSTSITTPRSEATPNSTSITTPRSEDNFIETTQRPSSSPPARTTPPPPREPPPTIRVSPSPQPASSTNKPPATTSSKPATKRPNLRRRLPSFRATSPRPTIRRRLPAPAPTTETAFTRPPTPSVAAREPEPEPEMPIESEDASESPTVTPFAPPVEPTTTRREYIMTVPPLLDFENVARDDSVSDDERGEAPLEATHLTSAGGGGGLIPEGATSAIIISAIIGGCAVLFFAVLMVFCMWRQHVSRRPIYPPPESSNSSSTSSTAFHSKLG